jgi:hypothetical protein
MSLWDSIFGRGTSAWGLDGIKLHRPRREGKFRPGYYSVEQKLLAPRQTAKRPPGGATIQTHAPTPLVRQSAASVQAPPYQPQVTYHPPAIVARKVAPPSSTTRAQYRPIPPHQVAHASPAARTRAVRAASGLHGLGDDPGAGAPVPYVPNATVWVSVDPQPMYWVSPREIRDNPSIIDQQLMASSGGASGNVMTLPDGTAVIGASGLMVDPTLLANNYEPTGNYLQAARIGEDALNAMRQPILWPDGTPMVGRVWLPKLDMRQLGNPDFADFDRSIEVPWYDAHFAKGLDKTMDAVIRDQNRAEFLKLWVRYPGYRYLGLNFGNEHGDVNPLAPWRAINPNHMPPGAPIDPTVMQAPFGPTAVFSTSEWNQKDSWADRGGDVHRDTYTIHCSFDWSQVDPTTAAYPWLYDVFGPAIVGWQPMPADLWRSDGGAVETVGLPSAMPVPPWPFNCLEFQTALITGDHGVPVCVQPDGTLDVGLLEQAFAQVPGWDLLRQAWHRGSAFMLATIYDGSTGAAETAFDPSLTAGGVTFARPIAPPSGPLTPTPAPDAPPSSGDVTPPAAPGPNADGSTTNADGSITLPSGATAPAGSTPNGDGSYNLPSGGVMFGDGSTLPPPNADGSYSFPDGSMLLADGTVVPAPSASGYSPQPGAGGGYPPPVYYPPPVPEVPPPGGGYDAGGAYTMPDGTVIYPDGTVVTPDGTIFTPSGQAPPAGVGADDGSYTITINDDGSVTLPDGSTYAPDDSGYVTLPDGTVVAPDGSVVAPASPGLLDLYGLL